MKLKGHSWLDFPILPFKHTDSPPHWTSKWVATKAVLVDLVSAETLLP